MTYVIFQAIAARTLPLGLLFPFRPSRLVPVSPKQSAPAPQSSVPPQCCLAGGQREDKPSGLECTSSVDVSQVINHVNATSALQLEIPVGSWFNVSPTCFPRSFQKPLFWVSRSPQDMLHVHFNDTMSYMHVG